jgi:hypothetical protein
MAGELAINIDAKGLEQSSSGAITGRIWFQIGSVAFPEKGWNDFAVVILTWWLDALRRLISSQHGKADLYFMDGPYVLRASKRGGRIYLAAVDSRREEKVWAHTNVDVVVLAREIMRAARLVMEATKTKNWTSRHIDGLRRAMEALNGTSISKGGNGDNGITGTE